MDQQLPPFELRAPSQNGHTSKNGADPVHAPTNPEKAARLSPPVPCFTPPTVPPPGDLAAHAPRSGPPLLFDDAKRLQYCNLLHFGLTKGKAAKIVGVSPRTVQQAVKNDPELANRVHQARLVSHSRAAAQVALAGEKSWRAAVWLLEQGKRRRGAGRPRKTSQQLSVSLLRDDLKTLVRDLLLEVMPELRHGIFAPPAPIPPSPFVSPHLPLKHLPDVLQNKTHPNAQQLAPAPAQPLPEANAPHQLATNAPAVATTVTAHNP
ncbi:MAG: hypothetical protein WD894_25565 [Pirellulales bacterium]